MSYFSLSYRVKIYQKKTNNLQTLDVYNLAKDKMDMHVANYQKYAAQIKVVVKKEILKILVVK